MTAPETPTPRGWLVEIDGERWLRYDEGEPEEVDNPLNASTFESRDTAELFAIDHVGYHSSRIRLSPLY